MSEKLDKTNLASDINQNRSYEDSTGVLINIVIKTILTILIMVAAYYFLGL